MGDQMKFKELKKIESEKLLIVEGGDDENFFSEILEACQIENVQIINLEGKTNYNQDIPDIFKRPDFSIVKIVIITRDANADADDSFENVKGILERNNYPYPSSKNSLSDGTPRVGIYIISKPGTNVGELEDLCLETVKDKPAMKCVEIFIECALKLDARPTQLSKSKCKAYLAIMPESVPHVGIGALRGYWDLNSEILNDLKNFIMFFNIIS